MEKNEKKYRGTFCERLTDCSISTSLRQIFGCVSVKVRLYQNRMLPFSVAEAGSHDPNKAILSCPIEGIWKRTCKRLCKRSFYLNTNIAAKSDSTHEILETYELILFQLAKRLLRVTQHISVIQSSIPDNTSYSPEIFAYRLHSNRTEALCTG